MNRDCSMRLLAILALALFFAPLLLFGPASAKGVAVVVGIKDYEDPQIPSLVTPVMDARGLTATLRYQGYAAEDIHFLKNETGGTQRKIILDKWRQLVSRLQPGDTILFYFGGHGIELKGRNYLYTRDTSPRNDKSENNTGTLTLSSLDLQEMLEHLRQRQSEEDGIVGIFIIDACRENPFEFNSKVVDISTVGMGGANMPSGELFIMYSAGVGQTALDQYNDSGLLSGEHSVFAQVLIEALAQRDMPISQIEEKVRFGVNKIAIAHNHRQTPAIYNQLQIARTLSGQRAEPQRFVATDNERLVLPHLSTNDAVIECTHCPELVVLKEGKFNRGSPDTEAGHRYHEAPVREVTVRRFAMGKFEVTNRQWDYFLCDGDPRAPQNKCPQDRRTDPVKPEFDNLPVTGVSWEEVGRYLKWLNKASGNENRPVYRLPSEAEWEYAARSGGAEPHGFPSEDPRLDICRYANGADQSVGLLPYANQACPDGVGRRPSHVGRYKANRFHLHDMIGNVWEWVQDCWSDGYASAPVDGSPAERKDCPLHVARGGSWRSGLDSLRPAARNAFPTGHQRATLGFRVAREID